jgi:hypothetical protein
MYLYSLQIKGDSKKKKWLLLGNGRSIATGVFWSKASILVEVEVVYELDERRCG